MQQIEALNKDLDDLFSNRRSGHMGQWEYDVPNGPFLWQKFLKEHPEYYLPREEFEVIHHALPFLQELIQGPVSIVSLGAGSLVKKELTLAEAFQTASFHLVEEAGENLRVSRKEVEQAHPEWLVTAHQNNFYKVLPATPHRALQVSFGQTLFNVEGAERKPPYDKVRANLEALRRPGQFLLLTQDATQDKAKLEKAYRGQKEFALNVLKHAGIDKQGFDFDVEFHPESHCLAHYYTREGKRWHFNSSWKFPKDDFLNIAEEAGHHLIENYSVNGMAIAVFEA